jgi:hypothetical protein
MTPEGIRGFVFLTIMSVGHWFSKGVPHFPIGVPYGYYVFADKGKFVNNFL